MIIVIPEALVVGALLVVAGALLVVAGALLVVAGTLLVVAGTLLVVAGTLLVVAGTLLVVVATGVPPPQPVNTSTMVRTTAINIVLALFFNFVLLKYIFRYLQKYSIS
ncbi:MAG: hypothetical protein C4542_08840 [Dehalococcoidia bacterium]|nr:MAG: hypothetical protein C4542_08840 [Dehalococcoidia bacterium]